MESVQLVLDYFCERTPRSFVEVRDTSLVWNYKHADVEFGRLQARDLLQVRLPELGFGEFQDFVVRLRRAVPGVGAH
jgi:hypothetical protein